MTEEPTERTSLLGPHSRARVKVSSDTNTPRTSRPNTLSRDNSNLGLCQLPRCPAKPTPSG